jgi:hypothetical protein
VKSFYLTQLLIGLVGGTALTVLYDTNSATAFFVGVIVASINVVFVQYVWGRILGKKSVAWTLFVIVFKYTLLGTTLYFVAARGLLPIGWFSLGLGTILLSIFRIKLGPL